MALGDGEDFDPARAAGPLREWLSDTARREEMGRRAGRMVDGRGADRVADTLLRRTDGGTSAAGLKV